MISIFSDDGFLVSCSWTSYDRVIKMVVRRAVFIQSLIVVVYVLFNKQGNVVVLN